VPPPPGLGPANGKAVPPPPGLIVPAAQPRGGFAAALASNPSNGNGNSKEKKAKGRGQAGGHHLQKEEEGASEPALRLGEGAMSYLGYRRILILRNVCDHIIPKLLSWLVLSYSVSSLALSYASMMLWS